MSLGEFILAQSPHNMQGLLIGIFFFSQIANFVIFLVELNCFVWILSVIAGVDVILICLYVAVARSYRKRQREEPSQHNQQQVIEDVYELYFNQESENITSLEPVLNIEEISMLRVGHDVN